MQFFKMLKSLWRFLKEDKIKLILYIIIIFILSFQMLLYPYFWGKAISYLLKYDINKFLIYLGCWSGLALAVRIFLDIPSDYLRNTLEIKFMKKVSKALFSKVIDLPCKAYEAHSVGELVNRIQSDPDKIIALLGKLIKFISRLITVVLIIMFAISLSWILFVEVLIFIIVIFVIIKYFNPKIKRSQEDIKKSQDKNVKQINQSLTGIREVKVLGIKRIINKIAFKNIDNLFKNEEIIRATEMKCYHTMWALYILMEFIILGTCGYFFFLGKIPFESLVMFEMYLYRIYDVIDSYSDFGINYNKVVVSINRISEIVDNKLYEDEKFGNKVLKNAKGVIEFKDVYFAYDDGPLTLKGINLTINPGRKIAIVGRSGMGKSTIFNLLARFFDANKGTITIDGIDIKDITEDSLRTNISVIRQEPYLFNMSIKENFKLINDKITLKEIRKVCKKAYIDDYIMSLSDKYDTVIGEGGVNLSGGQKQRLAIARALAKNSKIILFDEATSALDNNSQSFIKQAIDELAKSHTVIIIAHRLTTIMDADEIIVIHRGKVADKGTHNYLIDNNELYRKLYAGELT